MTIEKHRVIADLKRKLDYQSDSQLLELSEWLRTGESEVVNVNFVADWVETVDDKDLTFICGDHPRKPHP